MKGLAQMFLHHLLPDDKKMLIATIIYISGKATISMLIRTWQKRITEHLTPGYHHTERSISSIKLYSQSDRSEE